MPHSTALSPAGRDSFPTSRLAAIATRQWGVVSWDQLLGGGITPSGVSRWVEQGRLHRIHPRVYSVGHRALSTEGRLAGALLYAGPGAALGHGTAAWWWQLWPDPPSAVHVVTSRDRRSRLGVHVHRVREVERLTHRALPVTSVAVTIRDLAQVIPVRRLRRTLAEADYRHLLEVDAPEVLLARRRPGVAKLRAALAGHLPELALARSELEERFLILCQDEGVATPRVNVTVEGFLVDALWTEPGVIVELDGHRAHARSAAVERDRDRELALRAAGFTVLRYTWRQVTQQQDRVVADLRAALG